MKSRRIGALCSTIVLYYVALVKGLTQQHSRRDNNLRESSTTASASASRRTFGIVSTASLTSLLLIQPSEYSAHADPYNALIPTGSGGILQQQATIQRADGWTPNNSPRLLTPLGISRIEPSSSKSIGPLQQSLSPFASQDLYYPSSFSGEWNVTSTLQQKVFPFGPDFVPSRSMVEGSPRNRREQVGDCTSYAVRFFSSKKGDKNPGSNEKIIADRGFNAVSMSRSYKQLSPVIADSIIWDYKRDPTRLTFQMESIAVDMRPLGARKAEVYLTARKTEELTTTTEDDNDNKSILVFAAAERSRTVTVGAGNVSANDQEVITEFRQINDNLIRAVSRVAVYLTPNPNSREGVLWQQVNGKAVAFYDYELVMERK